MTGRGNDRSAGTYVQHEPPIEINCVASGRVIFSSATRASRFYGYLMQDDGLLTIGVECYAGHRGEQTPRTLVLGDRRIAVVEVVDAWLAPDYRYFKLTGDDGNTYLVRNDERSRTWELTMFRAQHSSKGNVRGDEAEHH